MSIHTPATPPPVTVMADLYQRLFAEREALRQLQAIHNPDTAMRSVMTIQAARLTELASVIDVLEKHFFPEPGVVGRRI